MTTAQYWAHCFCDVRIERRTKITPLLTLFDTGVRLAEELGLHLPDIQPEQRVLCVVGKAPHSLCGVFAVEFLRNGGDMLERGVAAEKVMGLPRR
ncbi:hypothetical protein [Deinococcus sp. UYEF24]